MSVNIYPSIAAFRAVNEDAPKWKALEEAIRKAEENPQPFARAVRAPLTYWTEEATPTPFVGSRMYQTIIAAGRRPVAVEVASTKNLSISKPYDDRSDTECFEGTGESVMLAPGEVLAVSPDQAWRYEENAEGTFAHRARVTLVGPKARPLPTGVL